MSTKTHQIIIFFGGFFIFCIDQTIKYLSLQVFTNNYLFYNFLGWHPFKNSGVAFSLPLPNLITLLFTIPVISIIIYLLIKSFLNNLQPNFFIGLTLLFWGAISNLLDRLIYKATIDYLLIGTGIINIADVLIVVGLIIYLLPNKFFKI